jgi:hypothetical protein
MSIHVAHFIKSVIKSPNEGNARDEHTQPLRGPEEGLGGAMWKPSRFRHPNSYPAQMLVTARGDTINTMLVVPQVQSLSTQVSGILGRQVLVISGSGFASPDGVTGSCAKNAVTLAGTPCAVSFCNTSQLRCTIAPMRAPTATPTMPFESTFGLRRTTFSSDTQSVANMITQDTYTSGGLYSTAMQRSELFEAVFVAPQTAWYTFSVLARSRCELAIGESHNFSGPMRTATCPSNYNPSYDFLGFDHLMGTVGPYPLWAFLPPNNLTVNFPPSTC